MKKLLIFILTMFLTCSCIRDEYKEQKKLYNNLIKKLELININDFSNFLPFDLNIYLDKLIESEIRYEVVIDHPKEEIKDLNVLVIHNYDTNDPYPSIGIFDDKVNLKPNYTNSNTNFIKGIKLIGYIPYNDLENIDIEFRVYIEYKDGLNNLKEIYYKYQY